MTDPDDMATSMRLGELLQALGAITDEQLEDALHSQRLWGGRLGTHLVELGYVSMDMLSRAVACQYGMPAALEHHFAGADAALQRQLPSELAHLYACVPLIRAGHRMVIASMAPLDDVGVALVAGQLDIRRTMIVQSIAAERRIREQLDAIYGIASEHRAARGSEPVTMPIAAVMRDAASPR